MSNVININDAKPWRNSGNVTTIREYLGHITFDGDYQSVDLRFSGGCREEAEERFFMMLHAPDLRNALGMCLTQLCFALEQAQRNDDIVAGKQIAEAIKAGREAIKKSDGEY